MRKSHTKIFNFVKISKLTIMQIIQYMLRNPNISYCKTKYVRQFTKLNAQFQRVLLCHIKQNPNDNFVALSISSKSGYKLFQTTIRSYLKVTDYL